MVANGLGVLQPGNLLDRVAFEVAGEHGRSSEVDGLDLGFYGGFQWGGDGQDGLDALSSNGIIDHAEILSRVFNLRFLDDESSRDLLHPVVKRDRVLAVAPIDELVPPGTKPTSGPERRRIGRSRRV